MKKIVLSLLVGGLALTGAQASAASLCVGGVNADGMSVTDVTFRLNNADGCYGVVNGNDSLADINGLNLFGGGWEALVRDNGADGTLTDYLGIDWTLSAPNNVSEGNWTLTLADPPPVSLPVTTDLFVVLKGGNEWAGYYFSAETFNLTGPYPGTFDIVFTNNGGNFPDLSHMSVYLREGDDPGGGGEVPEPTTLALLGLGLLGAGIARRRR